MVFLIWNMWKKTGLNPIEKQVKVADLKHNSDLSRLDSVDEKAIRRIEKYQKAMNILSKQNIE